ncbi:DUF4407 domain-containing protein [Reichenbachiella sp. MALMAid0571]|uniref:DUF4407 domain-containing protein n=1 Tax=Reichenbachiella sp. MALMAid0571 TaxID=3143939 RepID=UPI0032DFC50B
MTKLESFFIYCSGISPTLLKRCSIENSKYIGIGASIFFTGLLAALSSGYALFTIFDSLIYAISFGILWGLMIFNLDRYIVLSMRKNEIWYRELLQATPRILLAILIALIISKPLEIKIFEKEINNELSLLKEEILKEQQESVLLRYSPRIDSIEFSIQKLKNEIKTKEKHRDELARIAQKEADGTGGSGKVNAGPIYKIKQNDAIKAQQELDLLNTTNGESIAKLKSKIESLESEKNATLSNLNQPDVYGISSQLTALNRLSHKYNTIKIADWFIVLLFVALELTPVLTKLISNCGPYDNLLQVHEHHFDNYRKEKIAASNINLEKTLSNA